MYNEIESLKDESRHIREFVALIIAAFHKLSEAKLMSVYFERKRIDYKKYICW